MLSGRERPPKKAKVGGVSTEGSAMEGPVRIEEGTTPPKAGVWIDTEEGEVPDWRRDNQ